MEQRQAHSVYDFADFRLDAQRRVLSSRLDGVPLQITGKVFDTLLYFIEHAGELLDKPRLLAALWPNVVVEESNLTQTIHTLRRVLGERPGEHRFIVTVPGRGYRFVADVSAVQTAAPAPAPIEPSVASLPQQSRSRIWLASIAAVVAIAVLSFFLLRSPAVPEHDGSLGVAQSPVVAVLPFVDMSEQGDQAYFAEGLSEEILNLIAQSATMRVIARTSSFSFKHRPESDIATIARQLEATHVLEGSVRKSGDHIRVTAQLVDASTSAHVWSKTYDRDVTDVFSVQDDIAAAVAAALNATLSHGTEPQPADTTNAQAFENYLHGKYFFNRGGEADVTRARTYFEQALQSDPNYARAWAGLAGTHHALLGSGPPAADAKSAQSAWLASIERGLLLGPELSETHVRAAQYYWWLGDWNTSEQHCKIAIALNPSDALVLSVSAHKAMAVGRQREALSLQRQAVAVDPLAAQNRLFLGLYLAAVGDLEEGEAQLRRARELSPTLPSVDFALARVLVARRRFDEALALVERQPASPSREQLIALVSAGRGQKAAADTALARLTEYAELSSDDRLQKVYVAEVHAFQGNTDRAFEWIASALSPVTVQETAAALIYASQAVHRSPFFISMRNQAQWESMLQQESIGKRTAQ